MAISPRRATSRVLAVGRNGRGPRLGISGTRRSDAISRRARSPNWIGYYGQGLRRGHNSIVVPPARVFRLAASRLTVTRGTALDASMLVEALGDADRLPVHLASAPELAEILDDWEAPR